MADYRDDMYAFVDETFARLEGAKDHFTDVLPVEDPTPYERPNTPIQPVGWVENADPTQDGSPTVLIDSDGITIVDGKLLVTDALGNVLIQDGVVQAAGIAAGSITASSISADGISADSIKSGTLIVKPVEGQAAEGIEVQDVTGNTLGRWDEDGIKIVDPANQGRYLLIDSGSLNFTNDNGQFVFTAAITPEGINASAINFGSIPGGHNLVLNSSFELADFVAAPSTFEFTDNTDWAAGARVTALDNITEGATALTATSVGF